MALPFLILSLTLAGCTLPPWSRPAPQQQTSPSPLSVSPSPEPIISPTPNPTLPSQTPLSTSPNNLLQAAIETHCFLSNNDPGTPGLTQILQKYNVTQQQVSDFGYKVFKKTLPPEEQAAYDSGVSQCRQ